MRCSTEGKMKKCQQFYFKIYVIKCKTEIRIERYVSFDVSKKQEIGIIAEINVYVLFIANCVDE